MTVRHRSARRPAYNQIVRTVLLDHAEKQHITVKDLGVQDVARLFALINLGMADAAISAWEAKYHYSFWRPITGIRAAATDLNPRTQPDLLWSPLGAPASNAPAQISHLLSLLIHPDTRYSEAPSFKCLGSTGPTTPNLCFAQTNLME